MKLLEGMCSLRGTASQEESRHELGGVSSPAGLAGGLGTTHSLTGRQGPCFPPPPHSLSAATLHFQPLQKRGPPSPVRAQVSDMRMSLRMLWVSFTKIWGGDCSLCHVEV